MSSAPLPAPSAAADSCASATSDSSPTATALRSCRCACDCSADHSKTQLRRHHRPPIRPTHSGIVQSAAEPCASSSGSPQRNSCFALRLTRPLHSMKRYSHPRPLRVLRRVRRSLSHLSGLLGRLSLQPSADTPSRCSTHHPPSKRHIHPIQRCLIPPQPLRPIQNT